MKKNKIIYWIATLLVAVPMAGNGVLEIVQPEMLLQEASRLGYPLYFFTWLGVAKIVGAILIVVPQIPKKLRSLGYAGFFFDFLFAFISLLAIGDYQKVIAPVLFLGILYISYTYKNKLA